MVRGSCPAKHHPALSLGDSLPVNLLRLSKLLIKVVAICISVQVGGEKKKKEDSERHETKNPNSQCKAVEVGHLAPLLFFFFSPAFQYLP